MGLSGLPAAISGTLVAAGLVMFGLRGSITEFFARLGDIQIRSDLGDNLSSFLGTVAVGSEVSWAVAYLGVFSIILFAGSWMVLRFVRD